MHPRHTLAGSTILPSGHANTISLEGGGLTARASSTSGNAANMFEMFLKLADWLFAEHPGVLKNDSDVSSAFDILEDAFEWNERHQFPRYYRQLIRYLQRAKIGLPDHVQPSQMPMNKDATCRASNLEMNTTASTILGSTSTGIHPELPDGRTTKPHECKNNPLSHVKQFERDSTVDAADDGDDEIPVVSLRRHALQPPDQAPFRSSASGPPSNCPQRANSSASRECVQSQNERASFKRLKSVESCHDSVSSSPRLTVTQQQATQNANSTSLYHASNHDEAYEGAGDNGNCNHCAIIDETSTYSQTHDANADRRQDIRASQAWRKRKRAQPVYGPRRRLTARAQGSDELSGKSATVSEPI